MLNFETVCRTCSLQGKLQSLFFEEGLLNPAEMLNEIFNIKVIKGDKYPQNICIRCFDTLKAAYLFKNQCQESYKRFEQHLLVNSETIIDCKEEQIDNVFIKEENQSDYLENNANWFIIHDEGSEDVKPYECDQCNVFFHNKKSFKRHLKQHEQLCVSPICDDQFSIENNLEHGFKYFIESLFNCVDCSKSFENKKQLQRHVKLEHSDDETYTPNNKIKQTDDKITREKNFMCHFCGRGYSQSSKLTTHIRTHTGEKPLACNECDKKFHSHSILSQHKRIHHSNEKPFKCELCGKCFAMSKRLKLHLKTHTNEKPYTCCVCNQKFRQTHHLARHKFVHTGEKPFSCNICDKKFTQNSNLRTHMRTHTGEKPYVCSVCGKGFHDSSSKKNHQKKHTLFEENQNVSTSILNTEK